MLTIYLNNNEENAIICNDSFFNKNTLDRMDFFKAKEIINEIDEVELTEDWFIISKFTKCKVPLNYLSTGCKTALNIIFNPSIIFTLEECGLNALNVIYRESIGKAFARELIGSFLDDIDCDIQVISKSHEEHFLTVDEMLDFVE